MKHLPRIAPNQLTRGDVVEVTYGARDGERGVVAHRSWDQSVGLALYLVAFEDRVSAWYGSDELTRVR